MTILSQSSVKAKQVPVISFAARGTLLHDSPAFVKWCFRYLQMREKSPEVDTLREQLIAVVAKLNDHAERHSAEKLDIRFVFEKLFPLYFESRQLPEEVQRAVDQHHIEVKVVIPQSVFAVCEELRTRGYRLAVVSDEGPQLIEVLRMYHLIDLFEHVLLSQDVGQPKPHPDVFRTLLKELDVEPQKMVHVGDRYATDVLGAKSVGIPAILYDPLRYESLALAQREEKQKKVVEIEEVRKLRFYKEARVLSKFEELLEYFQ